MASPPRPVVRTHRRARRAAGVLLAALLAAVALPPGTTAPASATTPDPCGGAAGYAPELRSVVITQGSNTRPPLVRGKTTVVRLFLNARECAPAGSVRLVSATLLPLEGSTPLSAPIATTPAALGPVYPVVDPVGLPISPENQANPLFQVPALAAASATAGELVVRFTATLTYQYSLSPTDVRTATVTYDTQPGGSPLSVTVAPRTNPLRVLLVPMGNGGGVAGAPPASQFPMVSNGGRPVNGQYADQTVQRGMDALSRLLPVADGVGDLAVPGNGLRYRLTTGSMLDLSPMRDALGRPLLSADGTFCGDAAKSSPIYEALATRLATWNKNNDRLSQADRVVGVVWQGVSKGVTCAEGFASSSGAQAWVRTFADRLPSVDSGVLPVRNAGVSMTGPLLAMELGHTFGSVPTGDPRRTPGGHSTNVAADPGHTLASYDTRLAKWLAGPLSVMQYTGDSAGYTDPTAGPNPWNNDSTLLETEDYRYDQCVLTPGMTTGQCPFNGTTTGSVGGAAQGDAFVLAGTLDATGPGAGFSSALVRLDGEQGVVPTAPDAASEFVLVQRDAAGEVLGGERGVQGIPVRFRTSEHTSSSEGATVGIGSVNATLPAGPGAAHIEIWKGSVGALCRPDARPAGCLYARSAGTAPVVTSTTGPSRLAAPVTFSSDPGDEVGAALSADGSLLAWAAGAPRQLVLQGRNATGAPQGAPVRTGVAGFDPAFSRDGRTLAFVDADGDVLLADVLRSGGAVSGLGTPRVVYDRRLQLQPPVGTAAARHPAFDAEGTRLVAQINGGVWVLGRSGDPLEQAVCDLAAHGVTLTCEPLVRRGANPSWQWTAGSVGLVAYEADDGIRTVDPQQNPKPLPGNDHTSTLRVPGGTSPAWGRHLLVHRDAQGLAAADSRDEAPDRTWLSSSRLTDDPRDGAPAVSADERAVAFDRPGADGGRDVLVGVRSDDAGVVSFTAATAGDPSLLRADVLLGCGNGHDPVLTALRPQAVTAASGTAPARAQFSFRYADLGACPGGVLSARVDNGYDLGALTPLRHLSDDPVVVGPSVPSPAVGAPAPGTTYLQYDPVLVTASTLTSSGTNPGDVVRTWRLTGPPGSGHDGGEVRTPDSVSCAVALCLEPPVPGGWRPGRYSLELDAAVPQAGGTATGRTSTSFVVLPDAAHAGRTVDVLFEPKTLFVPSNGNDVTLTVSPRGQDLSLVDPATVRLSEVGNRPTAIPLSGKWSPLADGTGRYTAKFSRAALTCEMARAGQASGYVRISLTGSGRGVSIRGFDPTHPLATPASPSATC